MQEYIRRLREYVGHMPIVQTGACVIILNSQQQILMERRVDNEMWGLPGGAFEPGETMEVTARREAYEETGLTVDDLTLYGVYSGKELFYEYPNGDQVYNVTIAYITTGFSGDLHVDERESRELRFFAHESMPDAISPPLVPVIRDIVRDLQQNKLTRIESHVTPEEIE